MDFDGNRIIAAGRARVWRGLNDPAVLMSCIPGCELFERTSETAFTVVVAVKVGPARMRMRGTVTLSDIVPEVRCTITGAGQGLVIGRARGVADLSLRDADADATEVRYAVRVDLGERLARMGGTVVSGVAGRMAEGFFARFEAAIGVADPQADRA